MVLIAIAAGVLVLVAGVVAALVLIPSDDTSDTSTAASSSSAPATPSTSFVTVTPPAQPTQQPPTTQPTTPRPQPSVAGADWQGFVDGPRCNAEGDQAVAIGQTSRSRVVICQVGAAGGLYYKGSADGNAIEIQFPTRNGDTFVAVNKGVSYVVSPQQLSINQNGKNLSTEPMLAYWSN